MNKINLNIMIEYQENQIAELQNKIAELLDKERRNKCDRKIISNHPIIVDGKTMNEIYR